VLYQLGNPPFRTANRIIIAFAAIPVNRPRRLRAMAAWFDGADATGRS
jgi:hypothetical protein